VVPVQGKVEVGLLKGLVQNGRSKPVAVGNSAVLPEGAAAPFPSLTEA
jgi:hypothetical protein